MKKIISVLLVAVMMLATMSVSAFAVDTVGGTCGDDITWTFDYDTAKLVLSGSGEMWDFEWPESPWISHSKFIESVEFSKDVTNIGNFAFVGCYNLKNVEIPNGVTNIGVGAFCDCNGLLSVTIPVSVTTIRTEAFEGYRQSLDVYYCGTQKQWEAIAIEEYSGLDKATIHFAQIEGECGENVSWLFDTTTGELAISGTGKMTNYSSASAAPWDEFKAQIKKLTVADGVTAIGNDTFVGCGNLEEIVLPESLAKIGDSAFRDCVKLAEIAIPDAVKSLGHYAFYGCTGLTELSLGNGVKTLGNYAFRNSTNIKLVIMPETLTSIGKGAFMDCGSIAYAAFKGTSEQWSAVYVGVNNYISTYPFR